MVDLQSHEAENINFTSNVDILLLHTPLFLNLTLHEAVWYIYAQFFAP